MGETITFIVNDIPMQAIILTPRLLEIIRKQEVEAIRKQAETEKSLHASSVSQT